MFVLLLISFGRGVLQPTPALLEGFEGCIATHIESNRMGWRACYKPSRDIEDWRGVLQPKQNVFEGLEGCSTAQAKCT